MGSNMEYKDKKVRQSNDLIESPYAQEFSPSEIKLFEFSIASCSKDDLELIKLKRDKEFSISNKYLAALLHTSPSFISQEIENIADRIMHKKLHLRNLLDDGSIEFEMINIIPHARYSVTPDVKMHHLKPNC